MVNYTANLMAFRAELNRLLMERERLDEQIKKLGKVIEIVQTLAEDSDEPILEPPPMPPDEERGFTDRVRELLKTNAPKRLTAIEIRDVLVKATPKDDPKIVLIHTHNTLKRLARQDEVEETTITDGRSAYAWKDTRAFVNHLAALAALADNPGKGNRKTIGQRMKEIASNEAAIGDASRLAEIAEAERKIRK